MSTPAEYHLVHARLRRSRGPASTHVCPCGQPASHWAYDRKADDERQGVTYDGRRVTFSMDLEHYIAMCVTCHHALDHPPKTVCKNGHEMAPENTYTRPNGGRLCRTCKRESLRRWRADNPDWRTR